MPKWSQTGQGRTVQDVSLYPFPLQILPSLTWSYCVFFIFLIVIPFKHTHIMYLVLYFSPKTVISIFNRFFFNHSLKYTWMGRTQNMRPNGILSPPPLGALLTYSHTMLFCTLNRLRWRCHNLLLSLTYVSQVKIVYLVLFISFSLPGDTLAFPRSPVMAFIIVVDITMFCFYFILLFLWCGLQQET